MGVIYTKSCVAGSAWNCWGSLQHSPDLLPALRKREEERLYSGKGREDGERRRKRTGVLYLRKGLGREEKWKDGKRRMGLPPATKGIKALILGSVLLVIFHACSRFMLGPSKDSLCNYLTCTYSKTDR